MVRKVVMTIENNDYVVVVLSVALGKFSVLEQ